MKAQSAKILLSIGLVTLIFATRALAHDTGADNEGRINRPSSGEPGAPVHQYLTKQAVAVWGLSRAPQEIQDHLRRDIYDSVHRICEARYAVGYDIIAGSADEDQANTPVWCPFGFRQEVLGLPHLPPFGVFPDDDGVPDNGYFDHFWDPDKGIDAGGLDLSVYRNVFGVTLGSHYSSAYTKAQAIWERRAIPIYMAGRKDRAYYWLGRVVHLLEDLTVPAHVHNDPHGFTLGDDSYEDFFKDEPRVMFDYDGASFEGLTYLYDQLPNINDSLFAEVYPGGVAPNLFKLFWYTAQRTQYFASDGNPTGEAAFAGDGGRYVTQLGEGRTFIPNLWQGDRIGRTGLIRTIDPNQDFVTDPDQLEILALPLEIVRGNLRRVTDVLVPHALKAVAGLYRLFWHETHQLTLSIGQERFRRGDTLALTIKSTADNTGDLYVGVKTPDGGLFTYDGFSWNLGLRPFLGNFTLTSSELTVFSHEFALAIPPGTYTFLALLVRPGGRPGDPRDWLTALAEKPFTFEIGEQAAGTGSVQIRATLDGAPWNAGVLQGTASVAGLTTHAVPFTVRPGGKPVPNLPVGHWTFSYLPGTVRFPGIPPQPSGPANSRFQSIIYEPLDGILRSGRVLTITYSFVTSAPAAPTDLQVTGVFADAVTLVWTADAAINEDGFSIRRQVVGGGVVVTNLVGPDLTSFRDVGLEPSTTYCYVVQAFNVAGESTYSNEVCATTPSVSPPTGGQITIAPPTLDFGEVQVGTCSTAPFAIQHVLGTGPVSGSVSASPNPPFSIITGSPFTVANGSAVNVEVRLCPTAAGPASGTAAVSNAATFTNTNMVILTGIGAGALPAAPSNLLAAALSATTASLAWTDNSSNESGFRVERKTGLSGTFAEIGTQGANLNFFNDSGLAASSTYCYRVLGFNASGNSGYSNEACATTTPPGETTEWIQLAPLGVAPAPRFGHTAVYNGSANTMTVFGGNFAFSDVWTLSEADGTGGTPTWAQLVPAGGPPAGRSSHTAVYAPDSNRMIVFGGSTFLGNFLSDTWVLTSADGSGGLPQWIDLNPLGTPPIGRDGHTAVYDGATNTMIVFGGLAEIGGVGTPVNDTWLLLNASGFGGSPQWVQLNPLGDPPLARGEHSAVYDPASNSMIVFGGEGGGFLNDVWVLRHANGQGGDPRWERLVPVGPEVPPLTRRHRAVFNSARNKMIVTIVSAFSNADPNDVDVWVLSGANGLGGDVRWSNPPMGGGPMRAWEHSTVYKESTDRVILFGGGGCCFTAPFSNEVWVLHGASGD